MEITGGDTISARALLAQEAPASEDFDYDAGCFIIKTQKYANRIGYQLKVIINSLATQETKLDSSVLGYLHRLKYIEYLAHQTSLGEGSTTVEDGFISKAETILELKANLKAHILESERWMIHENETFETDFLDLVTRFISWYDIALASLADKIRNL